MSGWRDKLRGWARQWIGVEEVKRAIVNVRAEPNQQHRELKEAIDRLTRAVEQLGRDRNNDRTAS